MLLKDRFILASASPRRRELLENIGVYAEVIPSDAEENINEELPPHILVQELALLKAAQVAKGIKDRAIVLGADTIVYLDGQIMGKPKDSDEAYKMLSKLSGNIHEVYTGICVIDSSNGNAAGAWEMSKVEFRNLSEDEILRYIASGEPFDKAGGYGIQGLGTLIVSRIEGDYFNIVGLPICRLNELLKKEFEIELL